MEYFTAISGAEVISTLFYTLLGFGLFGVGWWLIDLITPFSLTREIEKEQNVALAVLIGLMFLSLAIIIAAVILS